MSDGSGSDRRRFLVGAACTVGLVAVGSPLLLNAAVQDRPRAAARRALTVYFSRTGHTRTLAGMIHNRVGGDIVRVETVRPYPAAYQATVEQARVERDTGNWPQIRTRVANIREYDIIFLGSPIWGDSLNPPMKRFLATHDLSGKTIAPFATYIVSRMGQARQNIRQLVPRARVLEGLAVLGEDVAGADPTAVAWLRRIGVA